LIINNIFIHNSSKWYSHDPFGIIMMHDEIKKSRFLPISNTAAWAIWTTHEGLKNFFGADNYVEIRQNGAFEIYFLMQNPEGLRGSEGCKVLSYLPNEMLSFSWNVPPEFADLRQKNEKTFVVVQFKKISESQTEIVLTHLGWQDTPEYAPVFAYFEKAWDVVLDKMMAVANENAKENTTENTVATPKKVTGLGGVFFKCKDSIALKAWYNEHLGLETHAYGASFAWRNTENAALEGTTEWSPFADTTKYFEPSTKDFMLNYRVADLETLLVALRKANITILDDIETFEYGKFLHILDLEGNKVELWEP
jgi:uncharacterized protein YndB with AHSA1/START domain/predicted enzyme related to lactoylglutathione lyase